MMLYLPHNQGGISMKKIFALLLIFLTVFSFTACGGSSDGDGTEGVLHTEEGVSYVEVTLDGSFFDGMTAEDIFSDADEQGYAGCRINDDDSVTYTMTEEKRQDVLDHYKAGADEVIGQLFEGEGKVETFIAIDYKVDYSEINIFVDASNYSDEDAEEVRDFYEYGVYYQAFSGIDWDEIDVVVNFIDDSNGDVLNTVSYKTDRAA